MAQEQSTTEAKKAAKAVKAAGPAAPDEDKAKVTPGLRMLYNEIARLSATLGIARRACYTDDAVKAERALDLLSRQLPLAQEVASLLVPAVE